MPMHRRRVYMEHGPSRKSRIEGWLSFSIYLSAAILMLSLPGCLQDVMSSTLRWLPPGGLSDRVGVASGTEQASGLTLLCETLMMLSGVYLAVALFIQSHGRQGPH
jgi:hypothetical protein